MTSLLSPAPDIQADTIFLLGGDKEPPPDSQAYAARTPSGDGAGPATVAPERS